GQTIRADRVEAEPDAKVDIFIRQVAIRLATTPDGGNALAGMIALRSLSGAHVQYVVPLPGGDEMEVETPSSGSQSALSQGSDVYLLIDPKDVFALPSTEARS